MLPLLLRLRQRLLQVRLLQVRLRQRRRALVHVGRHRHADRQALVSGRVFGFGFRFGWLGLGLGVGFG